MSGQRVFDSSRYKDLNTARAAVVRRLLSEVGDQLKLRTTIDVGCGVGYFSGLLRSLGLEVTGVDGRTDNAEEAARRNPDIEFRTISIEDGAIRDLGQFDLVFCFGLLYHLENPFLAVRHLHAMTRRLLLVEAVIFPGETPMMGLVDEAQNEDQGLNHIAFYPTEQCLWKMLHQAGFPFVYRFVRMPDDSDYRSEKGRPQVRTMMAASFEPLRSEFLEDVSEPGTPIKPWDAADVAANIRLVSPFAGRVSRSLLRLRSFRGMRLPGRGKVFVSNYARRLGYEIRRMHKTRRIWIDVGAHEGETTFEHARSDSSILVFAFEPDWNLARRTMGKLDNWVMLPMAVADFDGFADFHLNVGDETSSLLPFNDEALRSVEWRDVAGLTLRSKTTVPTIRLDTFLNRMGIERVEYLKIDTQGFDFRVIQSADERLKDIQTVKLEVDITPQRCYAGSPGKEEVVAYMVSHGFTLTSATPQTDGKEENLTFVRG